MNSPLNANPRKKMVASTMLKHSYTLKHYECEKKIGSGGFAEVVKATNTINGKLCAIKRIPKTKNQWHNIVREVKAGMKLQHNNITKFIQYVDDETNDYLVFEFLNGK